MNWKTLTTPPPPRPPPPRYPLFTTDIFSTKSFGPGHLVGVGILVVGIVGIAKFFVARSEGESARARSLARGTSAPSDDSAAVARLDHERGHYGGRP